MTELTAEDMRRVLTEISRAAPTHAMQRGIGLLDRIINTRSAAEGGPPQAATESQMCGNPEPCPAHPRTPPAPQRTAQDRAAVTFPELLGQWRDRARHSDVLAGVALADAANELEAWAASNRPDLLVGEGGPRYRVRRDKGPWGVWDVEARRFAATQFVTPAGAQLHADGLNERLKP